MGIIIHNTFLNHCRRFTNTALSPIHTRLRHLLFAIRPVPQEEQVVLIRPPEYNLTRVVILLQNLIEGMGCLALAVTRAQTMDLVWEARP
jgi:hypothetical protein